MFILSSFTAFPQKGIIFGRDSLNQIDSKGKKMGYWLEYVDEKNKVSSKPNVFCRYIFYKNGNRIFTGTTMSRKYYFRFNENQFNEDSCVLMNGSYKLFDKKNKLKIEETYDNGIIQTIKEFNSDGNQIYYID